MRFSNTEVFNFDGAIRGCRNAMESWAKSDSKYNADNFFIIGENDLRLMRNLIKAGTSDSKFLRQIMVSVDIAAPMYWWSEADTYKVGTVANSTSKMHRLSKTPITNNCFEFDEDFAVCKKDPYENGKDYMFSDMIYRTITDCEKLRQKYLETNDKKYWRALIQLLPESWLQTRTVTMNYAVVRNMYHQRKNHKLKEWSEYFCEWVKTLPYAEDLIIE